MEDWSIGLLYVSRLVNNISLVKLHHIDQNNEFHPPDLSMGSGDSYAWCFGEPIQLNRLAVDVFRAAIIPHLGGANIERTANIERIETLRD
jgi:hypothetical protein